MNFAWAHTWIKTFSESADKVVELYADIFLFEDRLLGQRISDKEELCLAFKVFENTTPPGPAGTNVFDVLSYTGDAHHGVIEWIWQANMSVSFSASQRREKKRLCAVSRFTPMKVEKSPAKRLFGMRSQPCNRLAC